MKVILEYISLNYTWFLGGAIIILLAIIGRYADKTNFGQGKDNNQNIQNDQNSGQKSFEEILSENPDIRNKTLNDQLNNNKNNNDNIIISESKPELAESKQLDVDNNSSNKDFINEEKLEEKKDEQEMLNEEKLEQKKDEQEMLNEEKISDNSNSNSKFEEEFENFNMDFEQILPKKDIINDELLDEIENLSLDKTQKLNFKDLSNFDDVELPKIKSLESENKDVWKF